MEMADSRAGTGNKQDEPEYLMATESKEVLKSKTKIKGWWAHGGISKDQGVNWKTFNSQEGRVWAATTKNDEVLGYYQDLKYAWVHPGENKWSKQISKWREYLKLMEHEASCSCYHISRVEHFAVCLSS